MFIYDFPTPNEPLRPRLRSALIQAQPILNVRWNPNPKRAGSLALCCGGGGLYTWSNEWSTDDTETKGGEEEMAECIGVPTSKSDYLFAIANFFFTDEHTRETAGPRCPMVSGWEGFDPHGQGGILLCI